MLRFVSRKALGRLALVITLSLFATPKAFAQARDVAGAKDFPASAASAAAPSPAIR